MTEAESAPVTGKVMLYDKPEALSKEKHGELGVVQIDAPFSFMENSHFLPVTAQEFGFAALHYPIIFAGSGRNPLAVMGIRQNENLFVKDGLIEPDTYLPGFARRYPFVLAGDQAREKLVVCIDRSAKSISDKPDVGFFDKKGELSDYTKEAMKFLESFERDRLGTEVMVKRFQELDLLEQKEVFFQPRSPDGKEAKKQKIADYFAVTEERIKALKSKDLREIRDNGFLGAAYAHMISLGNWQTLINKTLRVRAEEAQTDTTA